MKSHCIACNGRQVPGSRKLGSGRIVSITTAEPWGWVIWNCPECGLTWTSPVLNQDDIGNAIAENALANAGTDIIEADQTRAMVGYEAKFAGNLATRLQNECPCGLPRSICTIHGPRFGAGRVA